MVALPTTDALCPLCRRDGRADLGAYAPAALVSERDRLRAALERVRALARNGADAGAHGTALALVLIECGRALGEG